MIKNIIFDIGNVLLNFNPKEYLGNKYSDEDASFLFSAIFDTDEWIELDRGTISEAEALNIFLERNPEKEDILREVMGDFYSIFTPIESTVEILNNLHRQGGYTLFYLSNIHLGIYSHIIDKYEFFKVFSGGIVSAEEKMLKPDKDIYHRLIEKYKVIPEESLFIDDTAINIEAAGKIGFETIHLTNPDILQRELEQKAFEVVN
ncbi:MAG: HAD family phosphatase [Spirochaetales bacterium]|nr:HAD family phosphatase [Spirochaetales bacterium]